MEILNDVPDYIRDLVPYPPGKPMEELERQYGVKNPIKLASNENSLGPSPEAVERCRKSLDRLNRYPDGSGYYLKESISRRFGAAQENIVLGNGSNELIDFLCRVFVRRGRNAVSSRPSFLVYNKMVQITGGENIIVPLRDSTHDLEAISRAVNPETRLIFLDNPNNPMGTVINRSEFDSFLNDLPGHLLVVLDEAYGEFVRPGTETPKGAEYLEKDPRVVTLRTFSKSYGLAGLRVGYGIMDSRIAQLLERVRQPFNVNLPAQEAGRGALKDEAHLEKTLENNRREMKRLALELKAMGCRPFESHTNFMLVDTFRDAGEVYEAMLRKGVIIRAMAAYGFPSYIRITIGTPEENQRFLSAFSQVLEKIPVKGG